jgi:EAL domain-containing protein (putative c-di-GMP-specific phosphodiesterase class I)
MTSHCGKCRDGQGFDVPFTMAFQPVIDLEMRRIYGYEALVRGPKGEPAISILSQVTPDTRYAFDQACRVRAIELAGALGLDRRLNINFMPNAVYEPSACIRATLAAAERIGFPCDRITFEITEDESISDHAHLSRIIDYYRSRGFSVALDDFGAGASGLNLLANIRPDIVKIDIGLVHNCDRDRTRRVIILAMLSVCRDLGITVVAEGVERREELAVLRDGGVRFVQGFLFARPALEALARDEDIDFG